jgi:transcriptional regulator with PAS, ATPase and Fis domain
METPLLSTQDGILLQYLSGRGMGQPLHHKYQDYGELRQAFNRILQLLDSLLNTPHEKVIITNREGTILFMNAAYAKIIGRNRDEVIGANVLDILGSDSRMHIVGQTLKPELHDLFHTANRYAVARRIPLISGSDIIGVLGKDLFDNMDDFFTMAEKAKGMRRHTAKIEWPKRDIGNVAKYSLGDIVSADAGVMKIKETAVKAARTTSTVLLQGETGVGKELFAHAIHRESSRSSGPFVRVNCGAIQENLLESELFGYDEGAFTGAKRGGKPGKFELAAGGTVFLDEIGEISLSSQVKILRVLQEKEIERVGGTSTLSVDVRIIASTNKDLKQLTRDGKFREDLYYRLNVVPVAIPPLRERLGDIPLLVRHFINKYNTTFGFKVEGISSRALRQFKSYDWPGNIRELEAAIESAMNMAGTDKTILDEFPALASGKRPVVTTSLKEAMNDQEASVILSVLEECSWDMEKTARSLEISVASLYRKLKKHKLN